jgi:hypothetical protein
LFSELLSGTIKFAHGHVVHLQSSIAMSTHYWGLKGFYPGRDKSGLENKHR